MCCPAAGSPVPPDRRERSSYAGAESIKARIFGMIIDPYLAFATIDPRADARTTKDKDQRRSDAFGHR